MKKFNLIATDIEDVPAGLYDDVFAFSARVTDQHPGYRLTTDPDGSGTVRDGAGRVIGFAAIEAASNGREGDERVELFRFGGRWLIVDNATTTELTDDNLHAAAHDLSMDHSDLAGLAGLEDWDGYMIACRMFPAGSRVYSREALGEAFGRKYDTSEEAQVVLERLQGAADRADIGYTYTLI